MPSFLRALSRGLAVLTLAAPLAAQVVQQSLTAGKRAFDINCARCHGIGGTGDTGPSLAQPVLPRAFTDTLLRQIIEGGSPGTEMPSSFWLSDADVRRIIAYVRSLGTLAVTNLAGNAAKGRGVYDRMECASCHVVNGVGGVTGPELSSIGSRRSPAYLRRALVDPAADFPQEAGYQQFALVNAIPKGGPAVLGVRINEDTFTIQIRDANGEFHSFRKADLQTLERRFSSSLMPSTRGKVTDAELEDLVAYLASLRIVP